MRVQTAGSIFKSRVLLILAWYTRVLVLDYDGRAEWAGIQSILLVGVVV